MVSLPTQLLSTAACRIAPSGRGLCLLHGVLRKLDVGESGSSFCNLTCSKHPADVIKRRGKALVDNMRCPRYLNLFFFNASHFFEQVKCHRRKICPPPQTVRKSTIHIHIARKEQSGVVGKALNVGVGNRWKTKKISKTPGNSYRYPW